LRQVVDKKVTVDAPEPTTKCLRNGALTCSPKFISSFNVSCRGQDAASKPHHCANTNVVGNDYNQYATTNYDNNNDFSV
jgi:hypothetical protein